MVTVLACFHCTYEYPFEALRSLGGQKLEGHDLEIVFLDDASPEDEWKEKYERMASRVGATIIRRDTQEGQASSRLQLIEHYLSVERDPDDIVCFLDGDDTLSDRGALQRMCDQFSSSEIRMAFGKMLGWPQQRYPDTLSPSTVRTLPWACPHLRCMRASLLMNVNLPKEMFQVSGEWLESATDQALMFELIEQGSVYRDNVAYTDADVMVYRIHSGGNLGDAEKQQRALENEKIVRGKLTDYYSR